MRKLFFTALFAASSIAMYAQESDSLDYELKPNEKMGYVITDKGEKIEGIVKLVGTDQDPWMNQKKVKFIAKSDINPDKKSQKFKVLDVDDIQEYVTVSDDGTERKFKEIKYTNKREGLLTQSSGGLGGKIKTIKNLSSTTHLAEVIVEGKISVYKIYGYPSPVAVGATDIQETESEADNLRRAPSIVYQEEEGGKVRELTVNDIKDLVSDCKAVKEKMENGGYSSYDPATDGKKKSGLGNLMKDEVNRYGDKLIVMSKDILGDYNATCGKK